MQILEITKCKYVPATTIEQFMNNLEKFIDITYTNTNPYSITKQDLKECLITQVDKTDDNSFNFNTIYDKLTKMKYLHGNCKIHRIPCEKRIKKDFYAWVLKIVEPESAGLKKKNQGLLELILYWRN